MMQHDRANEASVIGPLRLSFENSRDAILLLESILHQMSDAVIVADKEHHFLIFNRAAERMFGVGPTDTRAESWSRIYGLYLSDEGTRFPAQDLPLARAIRGEEVEDVEMFVRHDKKPDGI